MDPALRGDIQIECVVRGLDVPVVVEDCDEPFMAWKTPSVTIIMAANIAPAMPFTGLS